MTVLSVDQLLESEGLQADEVLGWARGRAAELVAELPEGSELHGLLAGLELPPVEARERPALPTRTPDPQPEPDAPSEESVRALADLASVPQEQPPHTTEEMELDDVELIEDDDLELVEEDTDDEDAVLAGDGEDELQGDEDGVPAGDEDDDEEDTHVGAHPEPSASDEAAPEAVEDGSSGVPELLGSGDRDSISEALEISEEIDLSDLDDL